MIQPYVFRFTIIYLEVTRILSLIVVFSIVIIIHFSFY